MRVMAQMGMVMNLDKCIGCHTCSVTCKQAWTNRTGVEYVWFNNVETRPGQGYPRTLRGPGALAGRLGAEPARPAARSRPAAGSSKLLHDLLQPEAARRSTTTTSPGPTTTTRSSPRRCGEHTPVARPKSLITGKDMKIALVGQLGRRPRRRARADGRTTRSCAEASADKVQLEFEQTFMFYLPRICEHCLNPSCVGVLPVRRDVQAQPRTASCWSTRTGAAAGGCASPAARTRRSTSTTAPARPRSARSATRASRSGMPTVCSETCVGRLRYIGLFLYDADRVLGRGVRRGRAGPLRGPAATCSSTRTTPTVIAAAERDGHPATTGSTRRSARRSTR